MKHLLWGLGLLLVLLLAGIVTASLLEENTLPVSQTFLEAADAAQVGDWQRAQELTADALRYWQRKRDLTAALIDHAPLSQVEALFAQLGVHARQKDGAAYASVCTQLSCLTRAINEENVFSWWNLL